MERESARAAESFTPPELTKGPPATGRYDGCESLGQVEGAQGALSQPEWLRGCEQTKDSLPRYVGNR
jgi:hypothetical protein